MKTVNFSPYFLFIFFSAYGGSNEILCALLCMNPFSFLKFSFIQKLLSTMQETNQDYNKLKTVIQEKLLPQVFPIAFSLDRTSSVGRAPDFSVRESHLSLLT